MSIVKPVPESSSVVMPMLVCRDVAAAIDFCKTAFGAVELGRRPGPDGTAAHALLISAAMSSSRLSGQPLRAVLRSRTAVLRS
jgi:uncharacterized glyoxalase superfamily protein PhnB